MRRRAGPGAARQQSDCAGTYEQRCSDPHASRKPDSVLPRGDAGVSCYNQQRPASSSLQAKRASLVLDTRS